ncbi:TolC family protein [Pseudomonas sp. S60]|uniref:TolC family protein n=1 Tax=Pseudomonas sp. S60 TaxID=211124 RepID=UPI00191226FC|nr:TolC family protein [Pseudomonas sp. S60]MBK5012464.1 TolC family protein [Pseudomonas sp. S60]
MKIDWRVLACMLLLSPAAVAEGVSALATAQARAVALHLDDAVALALRNNRAIRSAHLQRVAEKFDLRVAHYQYAPQLSLKARYRRSRDQQVQRKDTELAPSASLLTSYGTRFSLDWAYGHAQTDGGRPQYRDGANLMVIQPLLRGAGRKVAGAPLRQAQLFEQRNRLALKDTIGQSISQVIVLYRALLRAQEQLKITEQGVVRARQLVQVNQALIVAGRMAAFDIVQAEAEVANRELAQESSRNHLQESRLALAQALAVDLSTPLVAVDELEVHQVQIDAGQALASARALQPAYLMQLITGELLALDLMVADDQQWWDLSLIAGASQARERSAHQLSWERYVGLELDIPIGDLRRRQVQVQAQAALQSHDLLQAEAEQQLQRDVADAVRDLQVRWRQLEIAGRALTLSRRKLDIEQEKLTLGRSSNFEVLSFENDLRHAQDARLDAAVAYLNGQAILDQILGATLERWGVELHD